MECAAACWTAQDMGVCSRRHSTFMRIRRISYCDYAISGSITRIHRGLHHLDSGLYGNFARHVPQKRSQRSCLIRPPWTFNVSVPILPSGWSPMCPSVLALFSLTPFKSIRYLCAQLCLPMLLCAWLPHTFSFRMMISLKAQFIAV